MIIYPFFSQNQNSVSRYYPTINFFIKNLTKNILPNKQFLSKIIFYIVPKEPEAHRHRLRIPNFCTLERPSFSNGGFLNRPHGLEVTSIPVGPHKTHSAATSIFRERWNTCIPRLANISNNFLTIS